MAWYVLHTKLRNELKLSELLQKQGIDVFCPVMEVVKQWSDRKKTVKEPLFKGYVFVQLDNYVKERNSILCLPGAERFLFWLGKPGIVRNDEIEAIRGLLDMFGTSHVSVSPIVGANVTFINGPFAEKSGTVVKIKDNIVTVHLQSIGWKVMIETPVDKVAINK